MKTAMIFTLFNLINSTPIDIHYNQSPVYIDFHADYTTDVQGTLAATSEHVLIQYDLNRSACAGANYIEANIRNGGQDSSFVLAFVADGTFKHFAPDIAPLKEGSLEVWFICDIPTGNGTSSISHWDSNYGKNWVFTVEA
ncbi:hypothetical protein HK103_006524 [Boothiomyces macroporosus]|uniref:Uncharacterized protein n=1 Tax=Boothiomyces macroporosus TaxID=261099 RepID=A0AAD5UL84_9FUNG|nr:hypothetical protein HK103_006524 [Boothiomyces macroporosus]